MFTKLFKVDMDQFRIIIIYPNGSFHLRSTDKFFADEKKLLDYQSFEIVEKRWKEKYIKYK